MFSGIGGHNGAKKAPGWGPLHRLGETPNLLLLFLHAGKSLAAIDRAVLTGTEGDLRLFAAAGADSGEHLAVGTLAGLAGIPAGLAALGLVGEAALRVELLLAGGEDELLAALFAH